MYEHTRYEPRGGDRKEPSIKLIKGKTFLIKSRR